MVLYWENHLIGMTILTNRPIKEFYSNLNKKELKKTWIWSKEFTLQPHYKRNGNSIINPNHPP
ncbi:hypothetical protein DB895_13780 [Flavobacterium psychrotolerans]|uniref:Uncharacterized protein n=1 Tax=Flavobacterium psychrotolerans TaxID=2169410 RepID=A0A2U1JFX5_9FLAO|nr:hypothetical protein DB895_13780 [Flavobacterium psychrotolerans]